MKCLLPAVLLSAALLLTAPASAQDAALRRQVAELDARVIRLEGRREVLKLQRAFAYYVDRGLWHQAATLFADQGSIELGLDGVYVGPARIEEYLRRLHASNGGSGQEGLIYGQLNEWVTLQPVITVADDGRSATARWRDLGMLGQYHSHAEWRDGLYENSYAVQGGVWTIATLHLYVNFVAPYARGWARLDAGEGLVRSQTSLDFPPDRPPSAVYAPFPAVQVVPFAQPDPAMGRVVR